jgi:hypothetical protein
MGPEELGDLNVLDMTDMKVQQILDMLIDEGTAKMGPECASGCMMISMIYDIKEQVRESTNHELAIQFGVKGNCPDGCARCKREV